MGHHFIVIKPLFVILVIRTIDWILKEGTIELCNKEENSCFSHQHLLLARSYNNYYYFATIGNRFFARSQCSCCWSAVVAVRLITFPQCAIRLGWLQHCVVQQGWQKLWQREPKWTKVQYVEHRNAIRSNYWMSTLGCCYCCGWWWGEDT